jgi:thioredoxin-dependent peroxiredoxin
MSLAVGQPAPMFSVKDSTDAIVSLNDFLGRPFVIYFYPKDDTPGCTTEACSFKDTLSDFNEAGIAVVGVSRDDVASHQKFIKKFDLNFPLLSDTTGTMTEAFGVWVEKSMYGKTYMGIERTTFLMDSQGVIRHIWPKVKVDGHVEAVLGVAKTLLGSS